MNSPIEMTSGPYILREPIDNPSVDRRRKDWRHEEQLPAGRYLVRVWEMDVDDPSDEVEHRGFNVSIYRAGEVGGKSNGWHQMRHRGTGKTTTRWAMEDATAALVKHLVPDDSLEGTLVYADHEHTSLRDVIVRLVSMDLVSDSSVREAIAAQQEADQARWEQETRDEEERSS